MSHPGIRRYPSRRVSHSRKLDRQMPLPASTSALRPPSAHRPSRTKRRLLAVTSLGLAGFIAGLLTGCGSGILPSSTTAANPFAQAAGNWQISSSAATAARLPPVGGSLTVSSASNATATVAGILHPLFTASSCLPASTALPVNGAVDASGQLTLAANLPNGGTLAVAGTLTADRRSLTSPTYTITGGPCASTAPQNSAGTIHPRDPAPPVTAQQYQAVSGTYAGTLTTSDGQTFALSSTLTQTSQPDANGVYHVSGTAASPGNRCVPASLPATASTIDGGSISTTYTDSATGATISATGATSPDAATITISSWTINGICGSATGAGTLTRQ